MSKDTIYRQDAIDAIGERPIIWSNDDEYLLGVRNQYDTDKLAIETVPSAQPDYDKIIAEIKQCISETREHGKHHAKFVQDNGELYISGLEMALSIIEENR